ncbi:hypothetical protein M9Y10_002810 [Tritrichomonas musculus]|uniref:Uncharacterized protein n=1 Tax=Tritrichomonas musculus TaxID=1915356 RepID=A0ABR2LBQ5_9EUKA
MKKVTIPSKASSNLQVETPQYSNTVSEEPKNNDQFQENTNYTYEQVVNALSEVSVCAFSPPNDENCWNSRQDLLQVLKTIQILAMKRKQIEDETDSKRAKVIEPLTVRTKGNQALLDEAHARKKFLSKEIELNRQKLEALKQKKADQILQHEHELQEIKQKISDLNKRQKSKIKTSFSQSNVMASTTSSLKEEIPKKKRKSNIQNTSKNLFDEFDEDSIILQDEQKQSKDIKKQDEKDESINHDSTLTNHEIEPKSSEPHRSASEKRHSKSARNSLSIDENTSNNNLHSVQSSLSSSMKIPVKENYEDVQKRMLALYQAKRKSRNSSVSLLSKNLSGIPLNDNDKKAKTKSRMSLDNNNNNKLSRSLTLQSSTPSFKTKNDKHLKPKQNQDMPEPKKKNDNDNQSNEKNKNTTEHPKTTRTRIPKRPRITYTQC